MKKLKEDERTVQFNLVNNTSDPIVVDLFDLSLTSVPTVDSSSAVPPSGAGTVAIGFDILWSALLNPNMPTRYYEGRVQFASGVIRVFDTAGGIANISLGAGVVPSSLAFIPSQNKLYVGDYNNNQVIVIDAISNTVITTIGGLANNTRSILYVPSTNEIWVTTVNFAQSVQIIDPVTDTLIFTSAYPNCQPQDSIYDPATDKVLIPCLSSNTIWYINPTTRVLENQVPTPQAQPLSIGLVNNKAYVGYINGTSVSILDISSRIFTNNISYGGVASIYRQNHLYVPQWDRVYSYLSDGRVIAISAETETIKETLPATIGNFSFVFFYPNNFLYGFNLSRKYFWAGTFVQTPFYIGGATDYNFFVQNLEYEPMDIKCIGVYTTTQEQLYNPLAIKQKDSDGSSSTKSDFPILDVSQWQEQGNRAKIDTKGLIFDGRTFFSDYRINAGETVVFEICYTQFNRFCFAEFPQLFPDRKTLTKEITEDIVEVVCEREEKAKTKDPDEECKIGKSVFQLTMKNNTGTQQFVNLFDNFSLSPVTNSPSNNINGYGGNNSVINFTERPSTGKVYTFGGAGTDDINVYNADGNGFTVEYTHTNGIIFYEVDTVNDKLYFADDSGIKNLYIYDLGSGNAPTAVPYVGGGVGQPTSIGVDNNNRQIYIGQNNSNRYSSIDMDTLAVSTYTISPVISLTGRGIGYYSTNNHIIAQDGATNNIYYIIPNTSNAVFISTAGVISAPVIDLPDTGLLAIIMTGGVGQKIVFLDSGYNPVGQIFGLVGEQFAYVSYDKDRQQFITSTTNGGRVLFMTLESLSNNTYVEEIVLGTSVSYNGYMASTGLIFLGAKGLSAIATLSRLPDVQFSNPDSYNFFTESVGEEPVKVSCMDIITSTQTQLNNNLVIQHKDADGHISSRPKSPIVKVATGQEQGDRALVSFDKVILDGNETFASYPLNAGEEVTMVLYYHQFKRASLISEDNFKRVKIHIPEPIIDYGQLDKIANAEKYECEKVCKKIEISVSNTTGIDSFFNFFQANQTQTIVNQANATFDNVDDYNFLIQQLRQSPLVLCGIEIVGNDQEQLTQPVIVNTKDSNGDRFSYQHFPINYVDTNQRNGDRVFVKTNHLILDGYSTFPLYRIKGNGKITFVLYYRQYVKSDFLKNHIFPKLKKPMVSSRTEVGEDIEYYNDITEGSDNKWGIDGRVEKHTVKNTNKREKSVIFDTEQVYSDDSVANRYDYLSPFIRKVATKYAQKRADCKTPNPTKQNYNVDPNDLSFGKSVAVKDMSEQGFSQFEQSNETKTTAERGYTEVEIQRGDCYGERGWTYKDAVTHYNERYGGCDIIWKKKVKPSQKRV